MPRLKVVKPGLLTTIQDAGRRGFEHLGVMVGGWMDDCSSCWANRLVGNVQGTAVLEITLMGPELVAEGDGWLAWTGADFEVTVEGTPWPSGTSRYIRDGESIRFGVCKDGARAYLAAAGGFLGDEVLGSRSTDLIAGIGGMGGRQIAKGDVLSYAGGPAKWASALVGTMIRDKRLRILPGVRRDWLAAEAWDRLVGEAYRVNARSNRVGIRLDGPELAGRAPKGDAISEGMAIGAVQAPPSGELLVLTKSRGSIGGYPTLAHVITADWPVLAQLRPGEEVTFQEVDQEEAYRALSERRREMAQPLIPVSADHHIVSRLPGEIVRVLAPMWSTVYVSRAPGGCPLAPVGSVVEQGQVLAILEVMKQFYDLDSPAGGRVSAIHFTDGAMVHENTVLFEIEADESK